MRAFYVEADHVPKEGYKLSEREASTGRALRGNQIWKNIRGHVTDRPERSEERRVGKECRL